MGKIDKPARIAFKHREGLTDTVVHFIYLVEKALVLAGLPEALFETLRMCLIIYAPRVMAMRRLLCMPDPRPVGTIGGHKRHVADREGW